MWRTHNCGELSLKNLGESVILAGWVQRVRDKGSLKWIDLRDRYGLTQLIIEETGSTREIMQTTESLGREFVIQVKGKVLERESKNPRLATGDIEIHVEELTVLNKSKTPPFTIEDETDGGDELRMKYRYLDLRRQVVKNNMILKDRVTSKVREFLSNKEFIDIETPVLIKSTPEGARDFVVPSRMNAGEFYALPQSPQTFKQLLMVSGFDKYYQIVKCFRDEDLRADRQPEFTQIDCEMSFVEQEDVLNTFEEMVKFLFREIKSEELGNFPRLTYSEAMEKYGNDKPDIRFGMEFRDISETVKGKGFNVFDKAETVLGICAPGCASYTRKQLDELTDWVKRPQVGAQGMVYVKINEDGSYKSSVDKFYTPEDLEKWAKCFHAKKGDLLLILSGTLTETRKALSELRLHMGSRLNLRDGTKFKPLWVTDFPLVEWDMETQRYYAMHHPFTSPRQEDVQFLKENPEKVRANAYDLVINGMEIGGGSIRIHDRKVQETMFDVLGFTTEEALQQFGFLLNAFEYGAPPHGGIAFGLDRLCSVFTGTDSIRDFIAFPKNNNGRDIMISSPSPLPDEQLGELSLSLMKRDLKSR